MNSDQVGAEVERVQGAGHFARHQQRAAISAGLHEFGGLRRDRVRRMECVDMLRRIHVGDLIDRDQRAGSALQRNEGKRSITEGGNLYMLRLNALVVAAAVVIDVVFSSDAIKVIT